VLSTLIFLNGEPMKILLYFEGESFIAKSGIGRAMKHQMAALTHANIEYTLDPKDEYDILHINTVGFMSSLVIGQARKNNKKIIYHAHSTEEDFKDSYILSNQVSPLFKKHLIHLYSSADCIITPTPYSKKLLENYGIGLPIFDITNGVDASNYQYDADKEEAFYRYFYLKKSDKIVVSAGLHIKRKGIIDFIKVARAMPQITFIWFGHTPKLFTLKEVREAMIDLPSNVIMPGYVKGPVFEGAFFCADAFFFPSYEETEGIVVLEALAASQEVIVRDIGVYNPWLEDQKNCFKGKTNSDFIDIIDGVVNNKRKSMGGNALKTAQQKSLEIVGNQLKQVYEYTLKEL
jgi:1,2-diacylglycerol-3-alpha-glucose alpha-1,2-glucosyltransferase